MAVSVVTINVGYCSDGSGTPLGRFELASGLLKTVQSRLPASTPVLLPREYVAAFDRQLRDVEVGDPSYLLGESFMGGRWYYFPVLIAFKTPIPLLAIGVLAAVLGPLRRGIRLSDSVLLLVPPAVFLAMFSVLANKQLGIRMILPAAPLLYLWIATTLMRAERTRWMRWSVASLLVWFGAETLRIHPDYLTYFNQFAGGPGGGRRIALDSNLDWGQDLPKLKRYMDKNGIDTIQFLSDSVLLLVPPAVFLAMFSVLANKQLGIRMILPAAPLLYLWIATTLMRAERTRWMRWSVASLLVWFGAETLRIHPDYLTYFNQFAGGPGGGRRIALDSNLDWGQDLPKLKRYMDKNGIDTIQLLYFGRVDPEIYGIQYHADPRHIRAGPLAISATLFGREYVLYDHGTPRKVGPLDRGRFGHPVATLGNSIEVFRLGAP